MKSIPAMPPGHEPLCGCMHTLKQHDVQGRCGECGCKTFHFEGQAQMVIENPHYRTKQPPLYQWWSWHRSYLRKWLRALVGVTEDMANGTTYMQMTTSNIIHQAQLLQGLRTDIDAANTQQNPVNEVTLELQRRLQYYESEVGTGLSMSYRKLMRIDEKQREADRKIAMAAELDAANKHIEERKSKLLTGEFIDCPTCSGKGELEGATVEESNSLCVQCEGSGVVLNSEYKPLQPESKFNEDGVQRHLTLEE